MSAAIPLPTLIESEEIDFSEIQDSETNRVRGALLAGYSQAAEAAPVSAIIEGLESGDDSAFIDPLRAAVLGVSVVTANTFRRAAIEANLLSPRHVFDDSAFGVSIALRESRNRISSEIVSGLDVFVGELRLIGTARNMTARQLAREMQASIGLNAFGVRAVDRFRRHLEEGDSQALSRALRDRRFDSTLRRAAAGQALSRRQIDRMVDRYRARTIASRADLIARLEVQRQIGAGLSEYFEQSFAAGELSRDEVEQIWRIRPPNVRDSHSVMASQRRMVGDPFRSGDGNLLRFPGDPRAPISDTARCKCAIRVLRRST